MLESPNHAQTRMKKTGFFISLLVSFFLWQGEAQSGQAAVTYYYSPHCSHCLEIKSSVLPVLQEKYASKIQLIQKSTTEPKNLSEFLSLCKEYHVDALVPAMYVVLSPEERYLFIGVDNIKDNIYVLLDAANPESAVPLKLSPDSSPKQLIDIFRGFSPLAVAGAGLIDGINPCAFAVIMLFVSFLSVYGYERRQTALIGTFYIAAVFITYLGIGMGLFNFLYSLRLFHFAIKTFYAFLIGICFFLSGLSVYDFFRIRRGAPEGIILQLPVSVKKRIQAIFAREYRNKARQNVLRIAVGAFSVGIVVSLLEAVCTGQVYLPVIAFILGVPELKRQALWYLLLYNTMFILPLIIIFLLALIGISSAKMGKLLKSNLGTVKLLLAGLFFLLGIFILLAEFF